MSPEGRVIADSDGHAYASDRFVSSLPEALFQQIASPPAYSFISLPHWQGDGVTDPDSLASQIVIASGIRGETGQVLAVLVFRLSPEGEFSTILQRGRIGDTGESFAFNRAGRLISELRFGDRLRQIGILGEGQGTILNVEVRDPGGNLMTGYQPHPNKSDWPFSFMARRAIAGNAGVDLDGYNDIRGVPVIAAWGWNEAFGFGVATELEAGEAYETLRWYQKQAVTGTVMAIVLILGLTTLFIRTRLRIVAVNTRLNDAYRIIKKHKERMEEELNIGREIQMSMIPLTFPAFPEYREFSIYADLQPAREVGGDYYDFFFMDEERICLCVGDVSGKGVPAALFMAVTKTLIKSRAVDDRSTASIITHVNDALSQDNKACMFVTLFVAILNVKSGAFTYTNAGHNKPYIRRSSGSVEQVEDLHGPVVGPVEGLIFGESALNLYKGDLLFIFTDGINEAMNGNGELFTDERIIDSLVCGDAGSAEAMVREVVTHVGEFVGSADQSDDITALAVQFFGKSNGENDEGMLIAVVNRIEEVEKVQEKLNEYLKGSGVGEEVNQQLNIVIDELLANIIRYGYGDEAEHEIEIRAELVDGMIRLILTDDGIPFNPLGTRAPFTGSSLDEREAGGLGIHLVRNLVDDISYRRQTGKNVLSVQKKIGEEREGQL
jgi:sigma-B regulation protein RsbU (phosphoserine phosphatase)